jgi:sugar phosphate isomerase/epimerase
MNEMKRGRSLSRRSLIQAGAAVLGGAAAAPASSGEPTKFQIACKTNPYYAFSFERSVKGISGAGFRFMAWGSRYTNSAGQPQELLPITAPPSGAKRLANICREGGLEPVLLASSVSISAENAVLAHTRFIEHAAAAGIPFLVTNGSTRPGLYEVWISNLKKLGPIARANNVTVVIKPHAGNTDTGRDCSQIVADVGDEGVKVCYDSGNVLGYVHVDPIADIRSCWRDVRAFIIKDHRDTPKDQDCGPGLGEIDHYKLLLPVARTGLTMPLACENIWAPIVPRPKAAEEVDALARRAREFLEIVVRGIQSV